MDVAPSRTSRVGQSRCSTSGGFGRPCASARAIAKSVSANSKCNPGEHCGGQTVSNVQRFGKHEPCCGGKRYCQQMLPGHGKAVSVIAAQEPGMCTHARMGTTPVPCFVFRDPRVNSVIAVLYGLSEDRYAQRLRSLGCRGPASRALSFLHCCRFAKGPGRCAGTG